MNKTLVALALSAAFASSAFAQSAVEKSQVTIYGIADVGISSESGGIAADTNKTKLTSGIASGSRLGFKGTEDLGNGLSAGFVLESGVSFDTGTTTGNQTYGRQSFVSLADKSLGSVALGRQYNTIYETLRDVADPFALGTAGSSLNLMSTAGSRTDNQIKYTSPAFNGFSGTVSVALGEVAGNTAASRTVGMSGSYKGGPVETTVAYSKIADSTDVNSSKSTLIAGTYDTGFKVNAASASVKVNAAYGMNKGTGVVAVNAHNISVGANGTLDSADLLLGATIPVTSKGKLMVSYIRHNDRTVANADASQFGIGYIYSLSKRTNLYTAFAQMENKNGADYTIGNATEAGSGTRSVNIGVRHSF
jgi:GBP family porin